ncbi:MAG TPA: transposase [Longimicrobiales bacterium]|nr:transposase [Longimicrobiales bacterium]
MGLLGARFADYVVADGLYAGTPFIELAESLGLAVVIALNDNIPDLYHAAQDRFGAELPAVRFEETGSRVEVWDAADFEPWGHLTWSAVRVVRYRQVRADGQAFEAYWLTSFSAKRVGPRALYRICKSRWAIENHTFNDAKNRYGLGHIAHHEAHSILAHALLTCLALCVERLYRLRYLRRGTHPTLSAMELLRRLWTSLGAPDACDTS